MPKLEFKRSLLPYRLAFVCILALHTAPIVLPRWLQHMPDKEREDLQDSLLQVVDNTQMILVLFIQPLIQNFGHQAVCGLEDAESLITQAEALSTTFSILSVKIPSVTITLFSTIPKTTNSFVCCILAGAMWYRIFPAAAMDVYNRRKDRDSAICGKDDACRLSQDRFILSMYRLNKRLVVWSIARNVCFLAVIKLNNGVNKSAANRLMRKLNSFETTMLKEVRSRLKAQKVIVAMLKKKPADQLEATRLEQSIEDRLHEQAGTHSTGQYADGGRQSWLSEVLQIWRIFLATLEAAVRSMPSAPCYPTISDLSESRRRAAPTAHSYRTFTVTRVRMSQFGLPQHGNFIERVAPFEGVYILGDQDLS